MKKSPEIEDKIIVIINAESPTLSNQGNCGLEIELTKEIYKEFILFIEDYGFTNNSLSIEDDNLYDPEKAILAKEPIEISVPMTVSLIELEDYTDKPYVICERVDIHDPDKEIIYTITHISTKNLNKEDYVHLNKDYYLKLFPSNIYEIMTDDEVEEFNKVWDVWGDGIGYGNDIYALENFDLDKELHQKLDEEINKDLADKPIRVILGNIQQRPIIVNGIKKMQGIYKGKPFYGIGYILEDDKLSSEVEFDKNGIWIEQRALNEKGEVTSAMCLPDGNMDKLYVKDLQQKLDGETDEEENQMKSSSENQMKNGKKEGLWKVYFDNGQLEKEGNFKDGKPEGLWKKYHLNGQLKSEGNLKDGKAEGLAKYYYESGQLENEGNFKNDKKEGLWKIYYESGQLESEGNFKDGKLEGLAKHYYESGHLHSEGDLKDGKEEGVWKTYNEDGTLKEEKTYKNGEEIN